MTFKKVKDPDATLDYVFDWDDWLTPLVDTIASVEFVLSDGLTSVAESSTATTATIFVSGGVAGEVEEITCRITTNSTPPRVDDRTAFLTINER